MGFLSGFVDINKAELGLYVVFSSINSSLPCTGGGVLPGKMVFSAVRGQHLGVKGRRRSEQD